MTKKTKTGYSTDSSVLEKLIDSHPIAKELLRYRLLTKLSSTYINALPNLVNPLTNRIHTSFNQAGTATGRLSSTDPNLQNIPIRTEDGQKIRHAFVPSTPDGWILSSDYSQIEFRFIIHYINNKKIIEDYKQNPRIDFHNWVAEMCGITRSPAKNINFCIGFGCRPSAIELVENPDILRGLADKAPSAVRVGFAAETENLESNAETKLLAKDVDYLVANDVSRADIGFESEANEVTVYGRDGSVHHLSRRPKTEIARELLKLFASDERLS